VSDWLDDAAEAYEEYFVSLVSGPPFPGSLRRLVNAYAILSRLYYEHAISAIPDSPFDALCLELIERFDEAKDAGVWHFEKIMDLEALKAGTGFHHRGFPDHINAIARQIARRNRQ